MDKHQNVTLAIPREVLKKAKIIAVQRNTSLSGLLTQSLLDLVAQHDAYEQARQRNLLILEQGIDMQTTGKINWSRDSLHDRQS